MPIPILTNNYKKHGNDKNTVLLPINSGHKQVEAESESLLDLFR